MVEAPGGVDLVLDVLEDPFLGVGFVTWHIDANDMDARVRGWEGDVDKVACQLLNDLHIDQGRGVVVLDEEHNSPSPPPLLAFGVWPGYCGACGKLGSLF